MEKKLFIIRHAIAEEREDFAKTGLPDEQCPLTEKGKKKMYEVAAGLLNIESEIEIFYQSPLTRSQQTVDILREHFNTSKVKTLTSLRPTSPFLELVQDLNQYNKSSIAIVGHENHLSELTTFLLLNRLQEPAFRYKKGGIALLKYEDQIIPGKMELKWLATPKILVPHTF